MAARLTLSTRAERYGRYARADPSGLSKKAMNERVKLIKAIGFNESQWERLSQSTRRKYIAAARRGNNKRAERARVKEVRARRRAQIPQQRIPSNVQGGRQYRRILALAVEANDMIYLHADRDTQFDENVGEVYDLLAQDSLDAFIQVYGMDYVEGQLLGVIDTVDRFYRGDRDYGSRRWYAFTASDRSEIEDERWWWYHGGTVI